MEKMILATFLFCYTLFSSVQPAKAWLDCPFGLINDPYPGSCARYIDTDNNKICDHSEPLAEEQATTFKEVKDSSVNRRPVYLIAWLIFLPSATYFIHWYLVHKTSAAEKLNFLSRYSFTYFWNSVLLISFLPVAISGFLLLFGNTSTLLLSWHNYSGVLFSTVAFLHLLTRLNYFIRILK